MESRMNELLLPDGTSLRALATHLYAPTAEPNGHLQVLLHGGSYDHGYWDIGTVNGRNYSYVEYMAARGYALLAIDLPGTDGRTGGDVELDAVAKAIGGALRRIRAGATPVPSRFATNGISLVGHSLGGTLATYILGHFGTADRLVVMSTGFGPERGASFGDGQGLDARAETYVEFPPEERAERFFYRRGVDPEVVAWDAEHLRRTVSRRLWQEAIAARNDPERSGVFEVACPTLIQLGEFDAVMPGSAAASEAAHWRGRAEVVSIPGVGHCINHHLGHEVAWVGIDEFLLPHDDAPAATAPTTTGALQ